MLLPPPQPAITIIARSNTASSPELWDERRLARLRVRLASPASIKIRKLAMTTGSHMRVLGLKKSGGRIEFATVATDTVALAVVLEVKSTTLALIGLPVAIEQVACGAVVEQDR